MKSYHKNPRRITKQKLDKLADTLDRLGDLGGIVHNLETDEIIGGHQRMKVFTDGKPEVLQTYPEPDEQGTVGHGFIIWKGKRYAYRQVRWDAETAEEANITANAGGGTWDWDVIANAWEPTDLVSWGLDDTTLADWRRDVAALGELVGVEVDYEAEWQGMPEFEHEDLTAWKSIVVHFLNNENFLEFAKRLDVSMTNDTKSFWFPDDGLEPIDSVYE